MTEESRRTVSGCTDQRRGFEETGKWENPPPIAEMISRSIGNSTEQRVSEIDREAR